MSEKRTQAAATVLAEMFLGLGRESTEQRIGYYLRLLEHIDPRLLREACDAAVLAREDDFLPGPGAIARAARSIEGQRREALREQNRRLELEAARAEVTSNRNQVQGGRPRG